jgi:hypothetical protein
MREINPLVALLGALTLRLYTPRNLLLLSAFGLGYAMTNMLIHPHKLTSDPLHPVWEKDIKILRSHKHYDEVLKLVNQHIEADPNSDIGYSLRSSILAEMKNYSVAKGEELNNLDNLPQSQRGCAHTDKSFDTQITQKDCPSHSVLDAKEDNQLAQQELEQLNEQARKNRAQLCNTNQASAGQVQDIYTQSKTTYICRLLNP